MGPALSQLRPGKHRAASLVSLSPAEDSSSSYFVVAVAKRNSSDAFTLNELRGKRSCHSALGSPAGWDLPVGALVRRGFIQPKDCDVPAGAASVGAQTHSLIWGRLGSGPSPSRAPQKAPPRGFLFFLHVGRMGNILGHSGDSQGSQGCHGALPTF